MKITAILVGVGLVAALLGTSLWLAHKNGEKQANLETSKNDVKKIGAAVDNYRDKVHNEQEIYSDTRPMDIMSVIDRLPE